MNISTFCRLILTISWWISIFLCQVPNFVQFAPRRTGWADQSLTGWAGWDWFLEVNASPRKSGTYRRIEATENGIYLMIYHQKLKLGGKFSIRNDWGFGWDWVQRDWLQLWADFGNWKPIICSDVLKHGTRMDKPSLGEWWNASQVAWQSGSPCALVHWDDWDGWCSRSIKR